MWQRHRSYENLTSNIIATLRAACEIEARYRNRLSWAARDRSWMASKSRLRNGGIGKSKLPQIATVLVARIGRAENIHRRWRWGCDEGTREEEAIRSWWRLPPSQADNSKVGTATMGEAKSVRVMGHRHAISSAFPLPPTLHPSRF